MSVGIVIPTKNKSDFIVLQFQYYTKAKSKHTLYIGDSSNKFHSETIKNAIKKYRDHIDIDHPTKMTDGCIYLNNGRGNDIVSYLTAYLCLKGSLL